MSREVIMYGDQCIESEIVVNGKSRTVYVCGKCNRISGSKHSISYCCSTHFKCDCGSVEERGWTKCGSCRDAAEDAKWEAKPVIEWDGEFPVYCHSNGTYCFDRDSLVDHAFWYASEGGVRSRYRVSSCRPLEIREFDVVEFACDDLPDEYEIDDECEINRKVNEILSEIGIVSHMANEDKLSLGSVGARIPGFDEVFTDHD